jgi:hypothetical protein
MGTKKIPYIPDRRLAAVFAVCFVPHAVYILEPEKTRKD